jgi:hypothetical protein
MRERYSQAQRSVLQTLRNFRSVQGDLSPVETLADGLHCFRLADYAEVIR